jgi:hypothetical protein
LLISVVMIRRWLLAFGAPLVVLGVPASALADEPPGCPPGEWFCDEVEPTPPEPEGVEPDAPEPDGVGPATEPEPADERDVGAASAAAAVDQPSEPPAEDRGWSDSERSPWGVALRAQGVLLESGSDASLWGVGASARYALNRVVTLDVGLDTIAGTDYNGYDRSELALSASSLLFLNQGDVVRTFLQVGLSLSTARVDLGYDEQSWGYLGGHAGIGLEFPLDSRIGLAVEGLGFMRGRIDSRAASEPEFTSSSGRVSNTSGGCLLRGGVVLRF